VVLQQGGEKVATNTPLNGKHITVSNTGPSAGTDFFGTHATENGHKIQNVESQKSSEASFIQNCCESITRSHLGVLGV
jgi:hypothetical protein